MPQNAPLSHQRSRFKPDKPEFTMQVLRTKRIRFILPAMLVGLAILAVTARGFFTGEKAEGVQPSADAGNQSPKVDRNVPRESITFIMGEDSGPGNRYYSNALQYYRNHPDARTDHLITDLRSLLEVRDHLEDNAPQNGLPWGKINLVVHSNQWTGMETPVFPGEKRSNAEQVKAAIESGEFPPLVDALIDRETELIVYGCALGRDQAMLNALSQAFGGDAADTNRPVVRSSRFFINYFTERSNGRAMRCRRMLADYRYAFYPTGYRPADYKLGQHLRESYPGDSLDYQSALSRKAPRFPGDSYHHTFRVPIVRILTYERAEDRPDFATEELRMAWLETQTDLDSVFQQFNLRKDQFTWTFQKIRYEEEDGRKVPAVKLIGLCDVLCILQPLTDREGRPLQPDLEDERYFAAACPPLPLLEPLPEVLQTTSSLWEKLNPANRVSGPMALQ
jgi:hypothetical protein